MDIFLICLTVIITAFVIPLIVWYLFKPKRQSGIAIRPAVVHKQGAGFGLDLGDRVVEETRRNDEEDLAQQLSHLKTTGEEDYQARQAYLAMCREEAAANREAAYQNQQAASRRAAEQNRRDEEEALQRQQAATKWAAEQNRRDQEAQMLQHQRDEAARESWFAENRPSQDLPSDPARSTACFISSSDSSSSSSHSSSDSSSSSSSCDSGSSSSSSD